MLRKVILLALLLIIGSGVIHAQDPDPVPALQAALRDLSQRLGVEIEAVNTSWTFVINRYTDTGLGCPSVTGAPVPEGLNAYVFTITYGTEVYDYRVARDLSIVFPCSDALLQIQPPPSGTPVQLAACPPNFEGYLPTRLSAGGQAQVISGNDPNRLRIAPSTAADQIGVINPLQPFDLLAGPSCSENYVWWQVSIGDQVGWTVEGGLPDQYYLEPVGGAGIPTLTPAPTTGAAVATLAPVATLSSQTAPAATVGITGAAGVEDDRLSFYNFTAPNNLENGAQLAEADVPFGISALRWSPDGQFLAYVLQDESGAANLFITERTGSVNAQIASGVSTAHPLTFSADGATIYYVVETGQPSGVNPQDIINNVFAVLVDGSAPAQLVATYSFGVGCGGGSPYPADALYGVEAGFGGNALVFEMTPSGIVHSTNCTGVGVALLDLQSGESVVLTDQVGRVKVSPAGTQLAGVVVNYQTGVNGLATVDLASGTVAQLGVVESPDQIAWGPDGAIYYSARRDTGQIIPGSNAQMFTDMGFIGGVPLGEVTLHRVDLSAATDAEIYRAAAYAIGRIYVTPDNSSIYFTEIANGEEWVALVQQGGAQADFDETLPLFGPALWRLPVSGGTAERVDNNIQQITFSGAALSAIVPDAAG